MGVCEGAERGRGLLEEEGYVLLWVRNGEGRRVRWETDFVDFGELLDALCCCERGVDVDWKGLCWVHFRYFRSVVCGKEDFWSMAMAAKVLG